MLAHEDDVRKCCQQLMRCLSSTAGQAVEITELMQRFTFESTGLLAFGRPFNMFQEGSSHRAFTQLRANKHLAGMILWAPWAMILLRNLPFVKTKAEEWMQWCKDEVEQRNKVRTCRCYP